MSWQRVISALMAVALVAAAFSAVWIRKEWSRFEARAVRAEQVADSLGQVADSAFVVADEHAVRADSAEVAADELRAQVAARVAVVREVVVPDTCAPFVAVRDSLIDDALETADSYKAALDERVAEVVALRTAGRVLEESNDSLLAVLRARPKPRSRLIPSVGVTVGVCSTGDAPCAAVGLTWVF